MKSGIYSIVNIINNKIYIGSTCSNVGFDSRWSMHKTALNQNKHSNKHLQSAWNKYGKDNFEFRMIEECNDDVLIIREDSWINYYDSINRNKGYNLINASRTICSDETRQKMSLSNKLRKHIPCSEETKNKIRLTLTGRKRGSIHTQEHKDNLRIRMTGNTCALGKKYSDEFKKGCSLRQKGNKHALGYNPSKEERQKTSLRFAGKKHSIEHNSKISDSIKNHWIKRKELNYGPTKQNTLDSE